jgi:hypothetical protein
MLARLSFLWIVLLLVLSSAISARAQVVSQASGAWNSSGTWSGGAVPKDGDDVVISSTDSVWLDSSTAQLHSIVVNGKLFAGIDTLNFSASPLDTTVRVFGTLDMDSGWFAWAAPVVPRPVVQLAAGSLFRVGGVLPRDTGSIYDSSRAPIFQCDDSSTFEYYSSLSDLTDVSYLANNLADHSYANLKLSTNGSFRSNPIRIRGTLTIDSTATVMGDRKLPNVRGYDHQLITISGDVVNLNQGESGSAGGGATGGGMTSTGTDEWIFDKFSGSGKDTVHWSGPSAVGTARIRNNTVLSIRYLDAQHCDSMDVLTRFIEENPPCGGHLIGKVYSEFATTFSAQNTQSDFAGLGITIKSGTPYLERTRVVRVSGYAPPGIQRVIHPVLRYYIITPGAGPQVTPNEMSVTLHCDELGYGVPSKLHFWRSRDHGKSWAFSGITSFDLATSTYTWDTTVLGQPSDSGAFYWTLAEGYMDRATPVDLVGFFANRNAGGTRLSWETASEVNVAGFELRAHDSLVATFLNDNDLRSKSRYGANYLYNDVASLAERYDLFEITNDGVEELLASRWVQPGSNDSVVVSVLNGEVRVSAQNLQRFSLCDLLGRELATSERPVLDVPKSLTSGVYFICVEIGEKRPILKKIVLP